MSKGQFIHLVDTTLRDGSHAVAHQFTREQIRAIAGGLDDAGIEYIEVSHGDGLAGSSYNYGWAALSDEEMLQAAAEVIHKGKLTVLLLPGIGTQEDLKLAIDCGAKAVRVATHVTEADIGEQHIGMAKKMGLEAFGFLMMSHMVPPEKVVEQALLFESYGADYIYIGDSAGAMLPDEVKAKVEAVVEKVRVPVGFHAHNNLTLATANCLAALEAGATFLDGACRGLGAGAGNAQTEALVGVLDRAGYR
ncbi:MAG: 4-hydroxy-2-oxovalerate aldolase, partial [Moorellaceae bacterium]